jgi:hypothetical protein
VDAVEDKRFLSGFEIGSLFVQPSHYIDGATPTHEQDPGTSYSLGSITKNYILDVPTQLGPLQRTTFLRYLLSWVHDKEQHSGGTYSAGSIAKKLHLEVPTQLGPLQRTTFWKYWAHYKELHPVGTYSVGSITKNYILEVPMQLGPLQRNTRYRPTVKRQTHLGISLIHRKCSPAAKWACVIVTPARLLRVPVVLKDAFPTD